MNGLTIIFLSALFIPAWAVAWDGYDLETGSAIEIDENTPVQEGEVIDYYDSESGKNQSGEVINIQRTGRGAGVEVYDYETGELRSFDLE